LSVFREVPVSLEVSVSLEASVSLDGGAARVRARRVAPN